MFRVTFIKTIHGICIIRIEPFSLPIMNSVTKLMFNCVYNHYNDDEYQYGQFVWLIETIILTSCKIKASNICIYDKLLLMLIYSNNDLNSLFFIRWKLFYCIQFDIHIVYFYLELIALSRHSLTRVPLLITNAANKSWSASA